MRKLTTNWRRAALIVAAAAGVSCVLLSPAANADDQNTYGKTYGEWSASWWQWAYSISKAPDDPVSGLGAVDCSRGQQGGPVFFLAGLPAKFEDLPNHFVEFSGSRQCTVPLGKSLFFPFVNAAYVNEPGQNVGVPEKREALDFFLVGARFICGASATVDGAPPYQLLTVRTQSPTFPARTVANNTFNLDPATYDPEAVSDGYWMMVPPLSKGHHTLTLSGMFCNAEDTSDPASPLIPYVAFKMIYDLTVGK